MKYSTNRDTHTIDVGRRRVIRTMALGAGLLGIGSIGLARIAQAADPKTVRLVVFDDSGERVGDKTLPKVEKSKAEWKKQLSDASYRITREDGTERAYSGAYEKPDEPGIYRCICCDTALYDAATMFHSGTGWPSFWQPIAAENISEHTDNSFGMRRTEIACKRCDAHLGHVFHDGPQPTGLRYCMNSVAMRFVPHSTA